MSLHASEVARGERFEFGENWSRFLAALDDERIREAEDSLKRMLEGRSFLDIGSGSGLFSLAARRLGARVHSLGLFDVVYSWGVLHHTGEMWKALENAQLPVRLGCNEFVFVRDGGRE